MPRNSVSFTQYCDGSSGREAKAMGGERFKFKIKPKGLSIPVQRIRESS